MGLGAIVGRLLMMLVVRRVPENGESLTDTGAMEVFITIVVTDDAISALVLQS